MYNIILTRQLERGVVLEKPKITLCSMFTY